jgi:hypothetical protein
VLTVHALDSYRAEQVCTAFVAKFLVFIIYCLLYAAEAGGARASFWLQSCPALSAVVGLRCVPLSEVRFARQWA